MPDTMENNSTQMQVQGEHVSVPQEKVYVNLHESYVRENVERKDGSGTYNLAKLPNNTIIDGQNCAGWCFYPKYVNYANKFDEQGNLMRDENGKPVPNKDNPTRTMPIPKDWTIQLTHFDEQGNKQEKNVSPADLKAGIDNSYKLYKQNKREKTYEEWKNSPKEYLRVHKSFVKQGLDRNDGSGKFNAVDLPNNVIIDGRDFGGYSFYPKFVNPENKFDDYNNLIRDENGRPVPNYDSNFVQIPLPADKRVTLRKRDIQTGDCQSAEVEPKALINAIKEQRARYIENTKRDEQAMRDAETQGNSPTPSTPAVATYEPSVEPAMQQQQVAPTPVYEPPAQTEPSLEDLPPVFEPIEEPAQEEEKKPKFVPSTHEELAQRAAEYNANLNNAKQDKTQGKIM